MGLIQTIRYCILSIQLLKISRAHHLTHTIQHDGNTIISFTSRKTNLCPGAGLLPKGVLYRQLQAVFKSSHIDQTNPCSNTETPILSKFPPPCSPFLSQLVTAHSHRLARTTNPFSTLYRKPLILHAFSSCSSFQKPTLLFFPTSLLKLPSRVFGAL